MDLTIHINGRVVVVTVININQEWLLFRVGRFSTFNDTNEICLHTFGVWRCEGTSWQL